jgi:hypothetical protein
MTVVVYLTPGTCHDQLFGLFGDFRVRCSEAASGSWMPA